MKKTGIFRALLLAAALVLLSGFAPQASAEDGYWYTSRKTTAKLNIDAGRTFSMAGILAVPRKAVEEYYEEECYEEETSSKVKATWTSSNKNVASIGKQTGLLKTKKAGKTVIKAVMEGKTYTCTVTVRKKGTLITGKYKELEQAQKKLEQLKNKKVTVNNYKNILKAYNAYTSIWEKLSEKYDVRGYLISKPTNILVPITGVDWNVWNNLEKFANTKIKNAFAVQSVKRGSRAGEMTIVLKKPVSGLQYWALTFTQNEPGFSSYIDFSDQEQEEEDTYIDAAFTFKKNSKYVKVSLSDDEGEAYRIPKGYYAEIGLGTSSEFFNVGSRSSKRFPVK